MLEADRFLSKQNFLICKILQELKDDFSIRLGWGIFVNENPCKCLYNFSSELQSLGTGFDNPLVVAAENLKRLHCFAMSKRAYTTKCKRFGAFINVSLTAEKGNK